MFVQELLCLRRAAGSSGEWLVRGQSATPWFTVYNVRLKRTPTPVAPRTDYLLHICSERWLLPPPPRVCNGTGTALAETCPGVFNRGVV